MQKRGRLKAWPIKAPPQTPEAAAPSPTPGAAAFSAAPSPISEAQPTRKQPLTEDSKNQRWYYMDATGREFGPHSPQQMRVWLERNRLPGGRQSLVRLEAWRWHTPIAELFPTAGDEFIGAAPSWPSLRASGLWPWPPVNTPLPPAATDTKDSKLAAQTEAAAAAVAKAKAAAKISRARSARHWGCMQAILPDRSSGMIRCHPECRDALGYESLIVPGRLLADIMTGEELAFKFEWGERGLPQATDLMRLTPALSG